MILALGFEKHSSRYDKVHVFSGNVFLKRVAIPTPTLQVSANL